VAFTVADYIVRRLVICGDGGFHMTATALSTMVQFRRTPIVVVLANGIYGFEQFLLDASFSNNPGNAPKPYVVLNNWDFAGFAKGLGVQFAQNIDTPAALDAALAAAKAFDGPALIAGQVDAHGLSQLTGTALAGGGPLR
jgi:indolepyruvate decarboxylase